MPLLTNAVCMPAVPGMHATGHEPTCDRAACNVRFADSLATQVLNRAKFFMGLVRKREESVGGRCAACRKSPPFSAVLNAPSLHPQPALSCEGTKDYKGLQRL